MRSTPYVLLLPLAFVFGCAGTTPPAALKGQVRNPAPTMAPAAGLEVSGEDALFVGAGDIASEAHPANAKATGDLIRAILADHPGTTVFTAGDNAYEEGTKVQFMKNYEPAWGSFNDQTRPSPGNHDYLDTPGRATAYFDYFRFYGADPAARARGYYSYDLKDWHIVSLNSDKSKVKVQAELDAQVEWLKDDLKATDKRCILAYWHHPLFTSGLHGSDPSDHGGKTSALWKVLDLYGADVVVNGHDHDYERFSPQDSKGAPMGTGDGIVEFVVGTGGEDLRPLAKKKANSQVFKDRHYGILILTLHPKSYDWRFRTVGAGDLDISPAGVDCREKTHPADG